MTITNTNILWHIKQVLCRIRLFIGTKQMVSQADDGIRHQGFGR